MKAYFTRIAGAALLLCAFVLLLIAPAKEDFSVINFYGFLGCLVAGFLLAAGFVGTDPAAARLRQVARSNSAGTIAPVGLVPEESFVYASPGWRRIVSTSICLVMGALLLSIGVVLATVFRGGAFERALIAAPSWIAGAVCIWCPLRWLGNTVRVDSRGITARLYFSTVRLDWQDVVALIVREPHVPLLIGGIPLLSSAGVIYSVYSLNRKLYFTCHLPGAQRLASTIAAATGLSWH